MMSRFRNLDPDFEAKVRGSFRRQNFMTMIGASLTHVAPGEVDIVLPHRADLTQQHGFFHGGVTGAIADAAGGYAGYSVFPAGSSVLTVEFKINLIAPGKGDHLRAQGRVIKSGRTLTFCDLAVYAIVDGDETLCATGQQTLICLHDRPDS